MRAAAGLSCSRAELAISRDLDGLLSRRERRQLHYHLEACEACASFVRFQLALRMALRRLRFVPIPCVMKVFRLSGV